MSVKRSQSPKHLCPRRGKRKRPALAGWLLEVLLGLLLEVGWAILRSESLKGEMKVLGCALQGSPLRAAQVPGHAFPALSPQAITTREELHTQHARSLQEKDGLRKRVRELGEKADELQLQLFQCEGQLLAAEGRLKRQQLEMLVLVGLPGGWGPLWCQSVRATALLLWDVRVWPLGSRCVPRPQSPEEGPPIAPVLAWFGHSSAGGPGRSPDPLEPLPPLKGWLLLTDPSWWGSQDVAESAWQVLWVC